MTYENTATIQRTTSLHSIAGGASWGSVWAHRWIRPSERNRRTTRLGRRAMAFGVRQAGTAPRPWKRWDRGTNQRVVWGACFGNRGLWVGAGYAIHWTTDWCRTPSLPAVATFVAPTRVEALA